MKRLVNIAALLLALGYCSGSGRLTIDPALQNLPEDIIDDTLRGEDEFYLVPPDEIDDGVRDESDFNFKTLLQTRLKLKLNLFNVYQKANLNLEGDSSEANHADVDASVILKTDSGQLLFAGKTDSRGTLDQAFAIPAHIDQTQLTIHKSGFSDRVVAIEKTANLNTIDRTMSMAKTTQSSIENDLLDSDGDLIADVYDTFPQDQTRAFSVNVPAFDHLTITFEDNFPNLGDGDYNDFIARYKLVEISNADNQVVELQGTVDAIARVAGYDHRFGIVLNFPGAGATLTIDNLDYNCSSEGGSSEHVSDKANIVLFERTKQAFTRLNGGSGADNGFANAPASEGHHAYFSLKFDQPIERSVLDEAPFDPYLYIHNTKYDVHLLGKPPLENSKNPATPVGFRDDNGFPRALLVPVDFKYPKESTFIENAYQFFNAWRTSIGMTNSDWYLFPNNALVLNQHATNSCEPAIEVSQTLPVDGAVNVPIDSQVRIFFDKAIDATTVNSNSLQLLVNGSPVIANRSVSGNEIILTPQFDMIPDRTYQVVVGTAIKTVNGEGLFNNFIFSFTTLLTNNLELVAELDIYSEGQGPTFLPHQGLLYFAARNVAFGRELYFSDGTDLGTGLLRDIYSGLFYSTPEQFASAGSLLYFVADHPVFGRELFKTDGTLFGTEIVRDLKPGSLSSEPQSLLVINDVLYFTADDGIVGRELYKSDGSEAGTVLVKDININSNLGGGTNPSNPGELTAMNDKVFFRANDGDHGEELWLSNGTAGGTYLLADIHTTGSSRPTGLTLHQNQIYFSANDGIHGEELWLTDGTTTNLVADLATGSSSSRPEMLTSIDNTLFFTATSDAEGRELRKTDGSTISLVKDLAGGSASSALTQMSGYNGNLYFVRTDSPNGHELYTSDGSATGTTLVKKINPGGLAYLTVFQGLLYFAADDGLNGNELWRTDGTFSGTHLVSNIRPGKESANVSDLTVLGNELFFRIFDQFSQFNEALYKLKGQ